MFLIVAREPEADAPYWPGRRWIAAIDGLVWPVMWVVVIANIPAPVGVVGAVGTAFALLAALRRLHRAVWNNQRYRFTTWRWGRPVVIMVLIGWVLKLSLFWL